MSEVSPSAAGVFESGGEAKIAFRCLMYRAMLLLSILCVGKMNNQDVLRRSLNTTHNCRHF